MSDRLSKDHHYVPQGILRHFCFAGETTYYLSKQRFPNHYLSRRTKYPLGVEDRNIASIFKRRHYNSFRAEDGKKDDSVERFFAKELDNFVPDWIKKFQQSLSADTNPSWSSEQRDRFVQFFYQHHKRSPDFLDPIVEDASAKTFSHDFVEKFETNHRPMSPEEIDLVTSKEFQNRVTSNSRVENLSRQSEKILETLASMRIVVASPLRQNKQFIVGSYPVARFENYPFQPLGESGVELWTTLTPNLAVGFVTDAGPSAIKLEDNLVRRLNLTIAKQSSAIASKSPRLLLSLARNAWPLDS